MAISNFSMRQPPPSWKFKIWILTVKKGEEDQLASRCQIWLR